MEVFPAVFPLAGLTVAVAGEGEAADAKARLFAGSPARLDRIAAADAHRAERYAGARLAFIALPSDQCAAAADAARAAGALVNVVDHPALCDFTTPAIVDRGAVVGAVATGGAAPVLAAELRTALEAAWPERLGELASLIAALQGDVRAALPQPAVRRAWLRGSLLDGQPAALALEGRSAAALAAARRALADPPARVGRLLLLEPPASTDLLSLRALRALGRADLVVAACGVDPGLLAFARRDAERMGVAEAEADRIADRVAGGDTVVCVGPKAAFQALGPLAPLPVASHA